MINFSIPPKHLSLQKRIQDFIAEEIIPLEKDPRQGPHGPDSDFRDELILKAKNWGLLSPHVAPEWGGLGLSHLGRAIAFEEAGYSPLGPVAMNVFAPDEGNMHTLLHWGTPEQKEKYLRPLCEGMAMSCFAMTEPEVAEHRPAVELEQHVAG